jgi:hypothetical protein
MDKTYEVRAKPSYCMTCKTCNKRKPSTVLQKVFPHVRCIIDCTEVCIETPLDSSILEVSDTSPDDIARFPQVLGGIDNQSSLYHLLLKLRQALILRL